MKNQPPEGSYYFFSINVKKKKKKGLRLRKQAYKFHFTSLKCRTERQAITDSDLNETLGNYKDCLRQNSTGFEGCFNMHTYNSKQSGSETVSNL